MSQYKSKKNLRNHRKKPWPALLLAGGFLLVIGAILAFNKSPQPKAPLEINGAPSLMVDQEKVDLGDVKLGQTVTVKFKLTNVGDQNLRFSNTPYVEVVEGC
jgi:HYDIN/CFA65/VesB-like, Ig-like domain